MLSTNLLNFDKPNQSCCLLPISRWQSCHSEHWAKTVDFADEVTLTWGEPKLDEMNYVKV